MGNAPVSPVLLMSSSVSCVKLDREIVPGMLDQLDSGTPLTFKLLWVPTSAHAVITHQHRKNSETGRDLHNHSREEFVV